MMLSIILPVYNAEKYLERCLKSILSQLFFDFELILINDGSKDSSNIICETYANKDNRIVYIDQKNQGVAMARNVGLKQAKGKYIGFVDADDEVENDMFLNLIKPTNEKEFDVVISHYKICEENTFHIPKTRVPTNIDLDKKEIKEHILNTYYTGGDPVVPALWNKIYNSKFLKRQKLLFQNQKAVRASDYWFNFKLFQHATSVLVIKNANYCYNNSVTGSIINSFRENQFIGFVESQKRLLDANENFQFKIDYNKFYKPFYDNSNQFILNAISKKGYINGYKFIRPILKNERLKSAFKAILNKKIHLKLIYFFLKNNMILASYALYCVWHLMSSTIKK
ncbi:glycosyltransferase [Algibacter amylolyticus]|uniref:Glycosyltransferase n=1 Tax=Algibacter amylolyticus TaxID=1608400 RepID=A0A5M7BA27_9FLAO|nr:glycosyltransferase [Algibacter amylolyticus]KAA5825590.1 glycosyltransferase [Algibacter amylolyticus]MBB5268184.1 glycosyltransferase involved in cell wall biosynthesis [Algibacter amylolyticus]TSJ79888.1 glycosyltransferase [Algibacter amylolyticus]